MRATATATARYVQERGDPSTPLAFGVIVDGEVLVRNGDVIESTPASGGGAPADARYLTLTTNGTLTEERVFTPGTGLGGTDGGAGSTYTLAINDAGLVSLMGADTGAGVLYLSAAATFALLALAADKGLYATSASALATYDLTSAARTLLARTTAAGERETLGVAVPSLLGFGYDGAFDFDGAGAVSGFSLAASVYTATRDVSPSSARIRTGVRVNMAGYRFRCSGKLTLDTSSSFLSNNGGNASATTGGAATAAGSISGGGTAGANGRPGPGAQAGLNGTGPSASLGGAGGAGGNAAGGTPAGGSGGTTTAPISTSGDIRDPVHVMEARLSNASNNWVSIAGGGSGGGGAHDGVSGASGAGGAGGGPLYVVCDEVDNNGFIEALGGNGSAATGLDNGGGGAGGGGWVLLAYRIASGGGVGTVRASAGSVGAGSGTGSNGGSGASGTVYTLQLV